EGKKKAWITLGLLGRPTDPQKFNSAEAKETETGSRCQPLHLRNHDSDRYWQLAVDNKENSKEDSKKEESRETADLKGEKHAGH
ncbi:hypothetical protein K0M31_010793, partial [Melipona bicolor]